MNYPLRRQLVAAGLILVLAICFLLWMLCDCGGSTAWIHPLSIHLKNWNCNVVKRGRNTGDLYRKAISRDVPIRVWTFTKYHPNESSGLGGGWSTADGCGFEPGRIACAKSWWWFWKGHEFWVERYGRCVIGDNGPGWSGKYRFDLAAFSAAEVDRLDRGPGKEERRTVVIYCPRPSTCSCDAAQAQRR